MDKELRAALAVRDSLMSELMAVLGSQWWDLNPMVREAYERADRANKECVALMQRKDVGL